MKYAKIRTHCCVISTHLSVDNSSRFLLKPRTDTDRHTKLTDATEIPTNTTATAVNVDSLCVLQHAIFTGLGLQSNCLFAVLFYRLSVFVCPLLPILVK